MSKPFTLWTAATPNGYKVSIYLEELKAAYGAEKIDYEAKSLSFAKNEQKEEWFIKINPNGRIPAFTDHKRGDFNVFESAAILLYLAQHYDPEHKFSFDPVTEPNEYSETLQWIFFAHGGIGPMQGQANHFFRYAPEKIPYGINRYINETKRLYGVLEIRLSSGGGREYLVGEGKGKYSIADMNAFGWVRAWKWCGIENLDFVPHVAAWLERITARPAVEIGVTVPSSGHKPNLSKEEEEKVAEEARKWIMAGNAPK